MRVGQRHQVWLDAVPSCQFTLSLLRSDVVNAMSNGRQIAVTTGLMRFVQSDDELAWVLAHEIAHNVLGHAPEARLRAMLSAWLGATVGEAGGSAPSPRSLEADADYVGAYLMARAGYELEAVRRFWQRMGDFEAPGAAPMREIEGSHPTSRERIEAFDDTLNEIEGKRARGEALGPTVGPH
jgi:predicted Zn-dependent protease